jgi:hypothetical protein
MINRGCHPILDGELLFKPLPTGGKGTRRMAIQVIDPSNEHLLVYGKKPPSDESSKTGSSDNHSKMRQRKSLGGELKGLAIW